jgi:hypothetical protein
MKKKLKIAVGINSLVSTTHAAYSNHIQFFFRLGRNYTDIDFCLINPPRMSIDRMRNMAAEVTLDQEFDYLMFLDDDVLVPIDCLRKLINAKADIAAGDVFIRGYPFNHMSFRYIKGDKYSLAPIPSWKKNESIVTPVDAVGFSCVLIKKELLKKIEKPFFITGPYNTEDIYFCMKARSVDPKCSIVVDRSIVCGHILWQEVLDNVNHKAYKKYYETVYGKPVKDESITRGPKYLKSIQGVLSAK